MTPTVLLEGALRVMIHTRDNDRHHLPHVHVQTGGGEAVIFLGNAASLPSAGESRGLKSAEERAALRLVIDNQTALLAEWRRFHGG